MKDIEKIIEKTGCTREEAEEAYEKNNKDVVDAIFYIQENKKTNEGKMAELKEKLKKAIKEGNVNKIVVSKNKETILNIPVNIGVLGIVAVPWAVIVGAIAAYGFDCEFEIVKSDGTKTKL